MNLINHKTLNQDTSIEYININKENFYKISNNNPETTRGSGVYNLQGEIYITDQFATKLATTVAQDSYIDIIFSPFVIAFPTLVEILLTIAGIGAATCLGLAGSAFSRALVSALTDLSCTIVLRAFPLTHKNLLQNLSCNFRA